MSDYRIVRVNNKGETEPLGVEELEEFWEKSYDAMRGRLDELYEQIKLNDFTDSLGHKAHNMRAFKDAGKVLGK